MKKPALFLVLLALAATSQKLLATSLPPPASPVPETATWVAGALVLIPTGVSTFRALRQKQKKDLK